MWLRQETKQPGPARHLRLAARVALRLVFQLNPQQALATDFQGRMTTAPARSSPASSKSRLQRERSSYPN
jgi:hypothetical protein